MDTTLSTRLGDMVTLLEGFKILRDSKRSARRRQMTEFLHLFEQEHLRLQAQAPVSFNVFSVLDVIYDEVRHSAFLAWLLDAGAGHGQGNLFLSSLLHTCGIPVDQSGFARYQVVTEYSGPESIIDIIVWSRAQLLVYIENKVLAPEGPDQLARELRDMHRIGQSLGIPEDRRFAIYLTPRGRQPTTGDPSAWISLSYSELAQGFRLSLATVESSKVRHIVQDWIATAIIIGGNL
jgi:hypothetical protein